MSYPDIQISVGTSRKDKMWEKLDIEWPRFVAKLGKERRTKETVAEYHQLSKTSRDDLKDIGGFVGGALTGPRRLLKNVKERCLVTLDLDDVASVQDVLETVEIMGNAACVYSTHSHTPEKPRLRIVWPLDKPVEPEVYQAIARKLGEDVGITQCDETTFDPSRLMFWPSCSKDGEFIYKAFDGPPVDGAATLARYPDWKNMLLWKAGKQALPPATDKKAVAKKTFEGLKPAPPTSKPGIVGAFCRAYDIPTAIDKFIPTVYTKVAKDRYTYNGGSTTGGLVVYDGGQFAYSFHGTDPCALKLMNAFDLVRVHLHGELDGSAKENTPVWRLPSYKQMLWMLLKDEPSMAIDREMRNSAYNLKFHYGERDENDQLIRPEETDWESLMTYSDKHGAYPEPTISNALLILTNHDEIRGRFYYDEFKNRFCVDGDLPWEKMEERRNNYWTDLDQTCLTGWVQDHYHFCRPVKPATLIAMHRNRRHPVQSYLKSLEWDGEKRAETFFIDYMGAEDTPYVREVTKRALIGAAARILKPGCKHDHTLVLVGKQGCRKSSTLARLGKEWFSDSLYTVTGKDAYEQLQGAWIIEMGEMAATKKAELEQLKHFMSKKEDSYRAAYGEIVETHPRQCAFFGSTNDEEFLKDVTGNRRFWPVKVTGAGADKLTDATINHIWAEAAALYNAGEAWHLSPEIEKLAFEQQEEYAELDPFVGMIEAYLETPVPPEWMKWDTKKRQNYLAAKDGFGGQQQELPEGVVYRDYICNIELREELLYKESSSTGYLKGAIARAIAKIPYLKKYGSKKTAGHGRQHVYMLNHDLMPPLPGKKVTEPAAPVITGEMCFA